MNPRGELQAQIAQLGGGSILEYFDRIKKRYVTPNGCFGMKTSWSDFAPVIELGLFDRMFTNPAIIYLDRRDIVLQAISCYRARESGLWHLADGENALVNRAIRYDGLAIKEFFDALIAEKHEWEEFFCARGIVPLRLYYEDLVGNMGSGVEQIAELLGLTEVAPIAWPLPRVIKLGGAESDEWANRFREQFLTA
ncbi:MAG: hypothetical protein BroJett006_28400 [Betaproteobacteria bacterium]|nr:MAG: hypothetical protein BroJett006_28400 [Betaproteobacteria bacterium]